MKTLIATCVVAALSLVGAASAAADSATITAGDAGAGQIHVVAEISSTTCSSGGYCGWFSFAEERHSSLPCVSEAGFLDHVGTSSPMMGTVREEWTYEPFFPRFDKICVFVSHGGELPHPAGEAVISLPAGYGRQRTSAHNCSYFASQRRAQYYLELYPDDPSGLDADRDGSACESNPCPCGAEPIPAEPLPPAPAPPAPIIPAPSQACLEGPAALAKDRHRVERARAKYKRAPLHTRARRLRHQELHQRILEQRQTEEQVRKLCR